MKASPARCIACSAEAGGRFRAGGVEIRVCAGCGLAWRAAFPEAAEIAALYGGDYLERWGIDGPERLAQVRAMKEATYRAFFRDIRAHRSAGRLLDLGCAMGFLLGVARDLGFEVRGLDLNEAAIEAARRRGGASGRAAWRSAAARAVAWRGAATSRRPRISRPCTATTTSSAGESTARTASPRCAP